MNPNRGRRCWTGWLLLFAPVSPAFSQVAIFDDDFDAGNSAARWATFDHGGDVSIEFAYDYGARGIPLAPNSAGGTTIGLRLQVNNNDANAATDAVSLYPIALSITGAHTLRFDLWLNYNGGPGGGGGSTEFATAGLLHAGDRVVWQDNPLSDGRWFAVSGEGGAVEDYRVMRLASLLSVTGGGLASNSLDHTDAFFQALFPAPIFETPGAPGKQWVEVAITFQPNLVTWRINDRLVAIDEETTLTAGAVMLGYVDTFSSIAAVPADNFVIFDNVRVEAPDCNANGVTDAGELAAGTASDCNQNARPDDCESPTGGDYDRDGDVDADDLAGFAGCHAGPATTPSACLPLCLAAFDVDANQRVDLRDFAALTEVYTAVVSRVPPRSAHAPGGTQLVAEIAGLARAAREARIRTEITSGNVPGFVRHFLPVTVTAIINSTPTSGTIFVTSDYLAVGSNLDFVRMPMSPLIAQPIADAFECLLPTRKMVNAIYAQASVKLAPFPISPATVDITKVTTFYRHHETVEAQRGDQPLDLLVGGIKKDVVITPLLASNPNRVAIYGWHQLNGVPIQPLYLGHVDYYVDYSHGIRLVSKSMLVGGVTMPTADVLAHPDLHVLLSDEGPVPNPRY